MSNLLSINSTNVLTNGSATSSIITPTGNQIPSALSNASVEDILPSTQLTKNFKKNNKSVEYFIRKGNISKNKIKVTMHALDRFNERILNSHSQINKKKLIEIATYARYRGITCKDSDVLFNNVGKDKDIYNYARNLGYKNQSKLIKLYNKYLFVFVGDKKRTLVTVLCVPDKLSKKIV